MWNMLLVLNTISARVAELFIELKIVQSQQQ